MPIIHNLHKALRIVITEIRKEKLLDINEEDANKEGFNSVNDFLNAFSKANRKGKRIQRSDFIDWNPEVWVLNFELVKEA